MKFPVSVVAKKYPVKNSVKDENDVNRLNMICSTENKDVPVSCESYQLLQSAISPEILCKTDVIRSLPETDCENTSDSALRRRLSSDDGMGDCEDSNVSDGETNACLTRAGCSRQNSVYDDSGFNSSASEDKDDIVDVCDQNTNEKDLCESNQVSNLHRLSFDLGSEQIVTESSLSKSVVSASVNSSCGGNLDLSVTDRKCEEIDLLRVSSSEGIVSVQNSERRSERTEITLETRVATNSRVRTRIVRRRRRTKDLNNNNLVSEDFRCSLRKAPFKLVDCFQDRGFLAFIACVVYTLILVFLLGVAGAVAESVKSVVGRKDLMEMKESITRARSKRLASG